MNGFLTNGAFWLIAVNAVSVLWVAYYAGGRLSRQFGRRTFAEIFVHTLMLGGALAVVGVMIQEYQPHHWTEILFNVGVAGYFAVRTRRRQWERLQARNGKCQSRQKPHVKLIVAKKKGND